MRKHGSNYLLETYLKGLPDAVNPEQEEHVITDKNSDSGVVTEGDSEQSNNVKKSEVIKITIMLFGIELNDPESAENHRWNEKNWKSGCLGYNENISISYIRVN